MGCRILWDTYVHGDMDGSWRVICMDGHGTDRYRALDYELMTSLVLRFNGMKSKA